jgi:hypothetical protein
VFVKVDVFLVGNAQQVASLAHILKIFQRKHDPSGSFGKKRSLNRKFRPGFFLKGQM